MSCAASQRKSPRRLVAAVTLLAAISWGYSTYRADERHDAFLIGREALVSGVNDENLKWIYPDISIPRSGREILKRYQLTVFRE